MKYSDITPEDIARRVGRSGLRVRNLLRQLYPAEAPGSGGRWMLTDVQVDQVLAYFSHRETGVADVRAPARTVFEGGVPTDWYWEGHVQRVLQSFLESQGWVVTSTANAAARQTGDDIAAHMGIRELAVEVKGYPSRSYRDPGRANEVKPTSPTLQAGHWFGHALLKVIRTAGTRPRAEVAMGFPDFPRYRSLIADTKPVLKRVGIGVYVVSEDGSVEVALSHRPRD